MKISFDLRGIEAVAKELQVAADQIPYATSRALNEALFSTRERLINETRPRSVVQRRANFPSAVLHVDVSDKHNLTGGIREVSNTAPNLTLHAEGGTNVPAKASRFAIPLKGWAVRTEQGVRSDQTVKHIIATTPRRALRFTPKGLLCRHGRALVAAILVQTSNAG